MAYGANTAGGYLAGLTPEESRMRTLAAAFTQRGMDPQIQVGGWGGLAQGIGGLAQALAGRSISSQADKKQAETTEKVRQQIAAMGLDPKLGAVANSLLDTGDARGALEFGANVLTSPAAESWRVLSDDEEKAMGLDTSGSYKANNSGQVDVLIKPRESNLLTPEEFNQKAQLAALGRAPAAPKPPPSLTERVWETLLTGDPNSPEYGLAYQEATKPQAQTGVNEQGQPIVTYITPELPPNIRRPSYMTQASAVPSGASGPRPGDFSAPPSSAPAAPASSVPGYSKSAPVVVGESTTRNAPELRKMEQNFARVGQSLSRYRKNLADYGEGPTLQVTSPENASLLEQGYNDLMLEAKNLYDLGVLNGPDYTIMTTTLTPPTSLRAGVIGMPTFVKQLDAFEQKLKDARASALSIYAPSGSGGADDAEKSKSKTTKWKIVNGQLVPE